MEATLKNYFWLIKLIGVGIVVVFIASAGVNYFASKALFAPAGETVELEAEEPEEDEDDIRERQAKMLDKLGGGAPGQSPQERAAQIVVENNIFCPTCSPEPEEEAPATSSAGPIYPGAVKSKLPLMLLATMESDDPDYSMATILHTDTNTLAPYSPKDQVRAGVTVHAVDRGRVTLLNGRQLEYIELGGEVPPPPKASSAAAKPDDDRKRRKNSREIEGAAEAISCDKDMTSCTVDKKFVEKLLSNPAQLTKQARIVPAVRDGETKGYKFYGIRPGSLPKLLGMKNGDLLTSVNGHQLESLDQAMDLYTKLRRASHLSVSIERKGKTIQKEIDIK